MSGAPEKKVNKEGFGMYLSYTKLNSVIFDSDFVILGLYLLIFGSNIVCHAITTVETGWVGLVGTPRPKAEARGPWCA